MNPKRSPERTFSIKLLTRTDYIAIAGLLLLVWSLIVRWIAILDEKGGAVQKSLLVYDIRGALMAVALSLCFGGIGLLVAFYGYNRPPGGFYLISGALALFACAEAVRHAQKQYKDGWYYLDVGPPLAFLVGVIMISIGIYDFLKNFRGESKEQIAARQQIGEDFEQRMQHATRQREKRLQ
ncbi:MAG: hypothetical protein ACFFB3_18035 [Candidatus Hodarchaeota archaeon]